MLLVFSPPDSLSECSQWVAACPGLKGVKSEGDPKTFSDLLHLTVVRDLDFRENPVMMLREANFAG